MFTRFERIHKRDGRTHTHTHTYTTLFTKAWQIQNIDISVRKEKKYIAYKQKINRCKIILITVN